VSVAAGALLAAGGVATTVTGNILEAPAAAAAAQATAPEECSTEDLNDDPRLGPEQLQRVGRVASMLVDYDRLADLTPQEFLDRHWDPAARDGRGGWRYPPNDGYLLGADGKPIEFQMQLVVGQRVDRFGSERGAFLAPDATPYPQRSLPPQNLDVFDPAQPCNYYRYQVIKPFDVEAGPIAPAFGQPGSGLQFQLVGSLLPEAPETVDVKWLLDHGYLERVK
jgi:hypothetical protein